MHCTRYLLLVVSVGLWIVGEAQNVETDSLKRKLAVEKQDEKRVSILESLSYAYLSSYPDTALQYAEQGLQLAKNINFLKREAICTNAIGNVYFHKGDNAKALEMYLKFLQLKEQLKDGGRMIIPVGSPYMTQQLMLIEKTGNRYRTTSKMAVSFVPFKRNQ